jgi:fimbrial chaperone protein
MSSRRSLRQAAVCGLAFLLFAAGQAQAGSFQVGPVSATLTVDHPVAALTVRNTGADPAVIQLEAMTWSQVGDQDKYGPASDILATPPIFTVAAGASQVIRVGSRAPSSQGERAYRLFLREIPPPPKPGFQGMRMALEISLPLFVAPGTPITPSLHWRATMANAGHLRIQLTNTGTAHARLSRFTLALAASAKPLPIPTKTVYVLPGAVHEWLVDAAVTSGEALHLAAQTESGTVQADLVVDPR